MATGTMLRLLAGQVVFLLAVAALAAGLLPAAAPGPREAAGLLRLAAPPEAADSPPLAGPEAAPRTAVPTATPSPVASQVAEAPGRVPTATPSPVAPQAAEAPQARLTLTGQRFNSVAGNSNTPEGGAESSGWYFYYDRIEVELTFSESVTVSGSPYLELTIGPNTRTAAYHSGSGTAKLLFRYRVQAGDYDGNGAAIPQNALKLNYGNIRGVSGYLLRNEVSSPTELADSPRHKVDGSQGNRHPRFSARVADQVYDIGAPIPELTIPAVSAGNGALTYTASFELNCTGSSVAGGVAGGGSSPVNLRDWMIYTPPGPGDTHGGRISAAPGDTPGAFKAPTAGLRGCVNIVVGDADADDREKDEDHLPFNITVKFDYDTDNDGLIEVSKLSQLDAIRYDLNGDGAQGTVSDTDWAKYTAAFSYAMPGMGCPDTAADADTLPGPCAGYELTANLDFDTDDDGATYSTSSTGVITGDAGDAYYNGGAGWKPIGDAANQFTATFDGKDHTIANLFINVSATAGSFNGLFGVIGAGGQVKDVGLLKVKIILNRVLGTPGGSALGGLAGRNFGTVSGSYATGAVSASFSGAATLDTRVLKSLIDVGGLIGRNDGMVESSYATASVTATGRSNAPSKDVFRAGGLAGRNAGEINASYATGSVKLSHGRHAGGLVGNNNDGIINACYATGAIQASHGDWPGGLVGIALGVDQSPTRITASYATGLVTVDANTARAGGLLGGGDPRSVNSYWDTGTTGQSASSGGAGAVGQTTRQLQTPTGYTGIYANWNLDLDGDATTGVSGKDDPWDFGTGHQYPVLKYGGLSVAQQRRNFPVADNWGAPAVGDPVWATAPASANWQWQRETAGVWSDITGATTAAATTSAYIAAAADTGKRLRAVAAYTEGGISHTLTTANTGAVAAASSVANIAQLPPTVGSAALHLRLDPAAGIAAANIHHWRWLRCRTAAMSGATCVIAASSAEGSATTSYTPTAADVGQYLQAQVYYAAGDAGQTWTRAWGPVVGPVIAAPATPPPSGPAGG